MSSETQRIVLVEDDQRLAALVKEYLEHEGFAVRVISDGVGAVEGILGANTGGPPDLVVLDWMLPGRDGLSICRELRTKWRGPILMLTARTDDVDQVLGLEMGADDFIAKPASPRVLLARIRARLRATPAAEAPAAKGPEGPQPYRDGGLVIEPQAREASIDGQRIELTTAEFDLLWLLASHAGEILPREKIIESLRGIEYDGLDRSIDMRISKLRQKLGDDPKSPARIKTVRGVGYLFARKGP
jgi:two-component system response regulator RstA